MSKVLPTILITVGIFIFLVIAGMVFNAYVAKCNEGDFFIEENSKCYYISTQCQVGEELSLYNGEQVCLYNPQGFLDNSIFVFILVCTLVGWVVVLVFFILSRRGSGTDLELSIFDKKDFLHANDAIDCWKQWKAKQDNLPMLDKKYNPASFRECGRCETAQIRREWFVKFQIEMCDGINTNIIYTVITSCSRGKDWILKGMASWAECLYGEYKRTRDMPLSQPENVTERFLQQLADINPEKAIETQEKLLDRAIAGQDVLGQQQATVQQSIPPTAVRTATPNRI